MSQGEQAIRQVMAQCEKDAQDPKILGPVPSPAADERPLTPGEPGRLP